MSNITKMTEISEQEMREAVGGISYGQIQFISRFGNLNRVQVSALKYYNRLEDPAKYQHLMPGTAGPGVPTPTPIG